MKYEKETEKYIAKILKFKYFMLWFGLTFILFCFAMAFLGYPK